MQIRHAISEDKEQVGKIYAVLFSEMAILQPKYYKSTDDTSLFLEEVMQNPDACCFVAEQNRELLGFVTVFEQSTPLYPCMQQMKYAYLLDMAVLPVHRNKGVGNKLIQTVKEWAKERKLHHVALTVLEENDQAISFYQDNSFKSAMRTMRLEL